MNKRHLIFVALLCMESSLFAMRETDIKNQTKPRDSMEGTDFSQYGDPENLEDSVKIYLAGREEDDNAVQHFFDCKDKPYAEYKKLLQRIIPQLGYTQNQKHNPLVRAVQALDLEFITFLLEKGADPLFRSIDMINAFDAVNIQANEDFSQTVAQPAPIDQVLMKLKKNIKPGEVYTPFPLKGIYPSYKEKININVWLALND